MFILSITPDWFIHLLLIASALAVVVGSTLGSVKAIKQYTTALKAIGGIMLVLSLFLEGALHDNQVWQERVLEVEAKLAKAEAESAKQNTKLTDRVATKQQQVREKTIVVKQYIDREVTKYDSQCVIPREFIKAHNDAAEQAK
jgi:ABC-type anion transport system duplicated permease subunit